MQTIIHDDGFDHATATAWYARFDTVATYSRRYGGDIPRYKTLAGLKRSARATMGAGEGDTLHAYQFNGSWYGHIQWESEA